MGNVIAILGFCIVFVLPVIILLLLMPVYRSTRDLVTRLDGIQSRLDLLLNRKQIDLCNLTIPRSLEASIKRELTWAYGRSSCLFLIETHLDVNRKQAEQILDRYISDNQIESVAFKDGSSEEEST